MFLSTAEPPRRSASYTTDTLADFPISLRSKETYHGLVAVFVAEGHTHVPSVSAAAVASTIAVFGLVDGFVNKWNSATISMAVSMRRRGSRGDTTHAVG